MAFEKLTGTIRLGDGNLVQNLTGLQIEIFSVNLQTQSPETWLGSSFVDARGSYFIYNNASFPGTVFANVYKGEVLVKSGTVQINNNVMNITITKEEYDKVVLDDTKVDDHLHYILFKGKVVLEGAEVWGVPTNRDAVHIVINKCKFRSTESVGVTTIDAFGNFQLKIPHRYLFPKAQFEYNNAPQVQFEALAGTESLGVSEKITISQNHHEAAVRISDQDHFIHFYTEFDTVNAIVEQITGLDPEDFYTILNEDNQDDLNAVLNLSGIQPTFIYNIIEASALNRIIPVTMEYLYAMIRKGFSNEGTILGIEEEQFEDTINEANAYRIIDRPYDAQRYELIGTSSVASALKDANDDGDTLADILESIVGNPNTVEEFMKVYEHNKYRDTAILWEEVEAEIGSNDTSKLQNGFQILSVVGLQKEMIAGFMQTQAQTPFADFIAAADVAAIQQRVQSVCNASQLLCVPKSVRGDVPMQDYQNQQVQEAYAKMIYEIGNKLFVSKIIINRLSTDQLFRAQFQNPTAVSQFLSQNTEFDFRTRNIWDNDLNINDALRSDLMPLQNVVRVTSGDADLTVALMKAGIKSSVQLAALSEEQLSGIIVAGNFKATAVQQSFNKAKQLELHVKNAYLQVFPGNYVEKVTLNYNNNIWNKDQQQSGNFPDLESLFGNIDFCSCSDCSSMYSPGAYFTDLFNFIKTRLGDIRAYTELIRRRSDLPHIDISCKNANNAMPYIDLVNELLELIILRDIKLKDPGEEDLFIPSSFQTRSRPAELEAYPEHVFKNAEGEYEDYYAYTKVYEKRLAKAVFPNTLPFHLPLEESRRLLFQLDQSRYEMMHIFKPLNFTGNFTYDQITEYNAAAEWFGITRESADIITGYPNAGLPADLWKYYGFDTEGTWYNTLCDALPVLLKKTNLEYVELLQLLITDFLNPVSDISDQRLFAIVAKPGKPADTCKVDELMLEYRPAEGEDVKTAKINFFSRLHRFIRLYRASGWTVYQLDIVLRSFDTSLLNLPVFIQTYKASKLAREYNILPERISCLWSNIDITRYINFNSSQQEELPSVYDTLFRNKLIINPPDLNFEDPLAITGSIEENKATIIAAFGISERDINYFFGVDLSIVPTTLHALSLIFSFSICVKCADMSTFSELRDNIMTLGLEPPFYGSVVDRMDKSITIFDQFKKTDRLAFSWQELKYIFRHEDTNGTFFVEDAFIQNIYETLRPELNKLCNNFDLDSDPLLYPEVLAIKEKLRKLLYQQFSVTFNIELPVMEFFLSAQFEIGTTTDFVDQILITNDFINSTDPIIRGNGISTLQFADLYDLFYRLNKASLIINRLKIRPDLTNLFQQKNEAIFVIDYTLLPAETPMTADGLQIDEFFNLNDWISFRDVQGWNDERLSQLILKTIDVAEVNNTAWKELLIQLTGWSKPDLDFLLGTGEGLELGVLNWAYTPAVPDHNDYRMAANLLQLREVIHASLRIGLDTQSVYSCLLPGITSAASILLRKTLKTRYDELGWLRIIKPIQDGLRVQQRNALTDYILANPAIILGNNMKLENENDLFAYLLIDVEMEACMKTSRLKQGISSLQLFLDRIILNIEKVNSSGALISISDTMTAQWQSWRKWYRVWEANRKVFLYPENWIEPELRDNKSPLFKELEAYLLQEESTDAYVEQGFHQYLFGLDSIARLEPVCFYHEKSDTVDILHVISRANTEPHHYYYRKYTESEWTAWEAIDMDIKGDHIAPFMFNNKLHISWITFSRKQNKYALPPSAADTTGRLWIDAMNQSAGGYQSFRKVPDNEDGRDMTIEAFMNWTYLENGKWQKQQTGKNIMQMEVGRYEMNSYNKATYGTEASFEAFKWFTKKGDVVQEDFFKNRIYLFTPDYVYNKAGGVLFNIVFPAGWDEFGKGMHSFVLRGDVSREPEVVKYTEYCYQVAAPYGTRIHKMKFEQDKFLGNALKKNTTYERIRKIGYFTYSDNYFIDWANHWQLKGAPVIMLNSSPYGNFRLTGEAANNQYAELNFSRVEERFFFEDEKNTYFVEKVSNNAIPAKQVNAIFNIKTINPSNAIQKVFENYPVINNGNINLAVFTPSNIVNTSLSNTSSVNNYRFHTFYHAQINNFVHSLNTGGVAGLMELRNQSQTDTMQFNANYHPTSLVNSLHPRNNVQFAYSEPYSIYNWELFFHAPMMIAQRLKDNLKFEEAQKWYHYIFNPTSNRNINGTVITTNQRFWKFYPFYEQAGTTAQNLHELLMAIHHNNTEAVAQVKKWENNPFNPHIIARMRILAYMKNVLMKYLDNLIAWGDQLYQRDTIESINEATQLYILASNILGERPREIPPRVKREDYTFDELSSFGLDMFSNALVEIESFYAPNDAPAGSSIFDSGSSQSNGQTPVKTPPLHTFYFCLPPNDKMLGYWNTIADRLFKIRNCMTLDGIVRQLPLYEPPIDPALLVRATALGIDINTILDQVYGVSKPHYRFVHIVQKVNEIINDVKSLGAAVLSAVEKKDGEALALLRSTQELSLLQKVRLVKIQQINEAQASLESLLRSRENTGIRLNYYSTRVDINTQEQTQLDKLESAKDYQVAQGVLQTVAGVLSAIPTAHAQLAASGFSFGGLQLANVCNAASSALGIMTALENFRASKAGIMGGYSRRRDDWNLQRSTAAKELQQLDAQILAAEIRLDITTKELDNHDLQIENTLQTDAFMRSKFSNVDLYNWMLGQLSGTYFQSYQLAFDTARKAEQCYLYELPKRSYPTDGFIKFGYWDSLRKGLLSGEKLQLDVRRMETAYMDENARELEMTRHISLAVFSPAAMLELRATGTCNVEIPEELFDLDYPGHYMRRIKSVSLSIPCIAGPYTTINCQLAQLSSKYRKENVVIGSGYTDEDNYHSVTDHTRIATSSGQNDGGVFELNFRDERYLPYEGTGAISSWMLSFPDAYRQFDYETITDVIMHIQYTARVDEGLKPAAIANLDAVFNMLNEDNILSRFFSLRHEFSNEWIACQQAMAADAPALFRFHLSKKQFPFFAQKRKIEITGWYMQLNPKKEGLSLVVNAPELGIDTRLMEGKRTEIIELDPAQVFTVTEESMTYGLDITLTCDHTMDMLEDFYLVARYRLTEEGVDPPSTCPKVLAVKDFTGNVLLGYPAGVFDRDGNYLGIADSKEELADLWNNAERHHGFAKIFTTASDSQFTVLGDPDDELTQITAMHALQFDFAGALVLDSFPAPEGGYIDYGDGTVLSAKADAVLPPNTTIYRTFAANTPIPLNVCTNAYHDRTFEIKNFCRLYVHNYVDTTQKTVSMLFNLDSDYIMDIDNRSDTTALNGHVTNLRGYLPLGTRSLDFANTHHASFNTLQNIKNFDAVQPNLLRFRLRTGTPNSSIGQIDFGTWDFPDIQCLDFGTFRYGPGEPWNYTPVLIKDIIGTTNLPAKYPKLHTIGFAGKKYSADLNLAIPNIRLGFFGTTGHRLAAGISDVILQQLDPVKADTGGRLVFHAAAPTTPAGISARNSLVAKGMTIQFL